MAAIRILIVDDHVLFRQGLRRICATQGDFAIVGEGGTGEEAVALARELQPDVILMDILMPVMNGVDAARQIAELVPAAKVVMLTSFQEDHYVFEAVKAGACGYVLKTADWRKLVETVRAVHAGEVLLEAPLATQFVEEFRRRNEHGADPDAARLSPAEMDVLVLVARGHDNKAIAQELAISERTVANRLVVIFQKLQVTNRTQAALHALRRGWAKLDDEPGP